MFTKLVLISLLSICNCKMFGTSFDPDADLCEDPNLDGGVVAEDGETYLFKGDYYWRTRPLITDSGIQGYASLTTSKWPEVKGKVRLVFTVTKDDALITVFVVKNNWVGYQKGVKTMDGSVDSWPDFKNLKVTAAFTQVYGTNLVYVLHSDNNYYVLYDFTILSKPKKMRSGSATIRSNYMVFTEESAHTMPGLSLRSMIDVRAALTYKEKMFLLSRETYCALSLIANPFERECIKDDIKNLIGCPLDLSRRPIPTTRTTTTTTTKETKTATSLIITTTVKSGSTSKISSQSVSFEEPFPSDWQLNESTIDPDSDEPIRTGIPILGRELEDEELSDDNNGTTSAMGAGFEAAIIERNRQNSEFWFIAILVAMIAMSITAILVVVVISRVTHKKRPKGEEIVIK